MRQSKTFLGRVQKQVGWHGRKTHPPFKGELNNAGFRGLRPEKFPAPGGGVRGGGFRRQTKGEICHKNIRPTFVKAISVPIAGRVIPLL